MVAKKRARSAGTGGRKAKNATARRAAPRDGVVTLTSGKFADLLAAVATRTVFIAATRYPTMIEQVRENGKHTAAFAALARSDVPKEALGWVEQRFDRRGPVEQAIASELRIAFRRHLLAQPAKAGTAVSRAKFGYRRRRGAGNEDDGPPPPCTPLCGTP